MMRNSKLRAALPNVVKTIAQLRKDYVRTTNTATKNKIVASLQDLRSVKATIDEELALEDEELASADLLSDDDLLADSLSDDLDLGDVDPEVDSIDDLSMADDDLLGDELDDELDDEEAELALSTLQLAAAALRAQTEEADSEEEDAEEADSEEEDADEADSEEEDAEDAEEDADADSEEEEEEEDAEEEGSDDGEEGDSDEEEDEEDSEEILSPEELDALREEGLIDATTQVQYQLRAVRANLQKIYANDAAPGADDEDEEAEEGDEMAPDYSEDGEEVMATAEFLKFLGSQSAEDRGDTLSAGLVSAAKKITPAQRKKMEKSSKKNRKLRKFRSEWQTSPKGMKGVVMLPGGKKKAIRKKFYFSTYDAKGNFLGSMWFTSKRPGKLTKEAYKAKHNVKHPSDLPTKKKAEIAKMKKKPVAKKRK